MSNNKKSDYTKDTNGHYQLWSVGEAHSQLQDPS